VPYLAAWEDADLRMTVLARIAADAQKTGRVPPLAGDLAHWRHAEGVLQEASKQYPWLKPGLETA
jgi:hypothetical protein